MTAQRHSRPAAQYAIVSEYVSRFILSIVNKLEVALTTLATLLDEWCKFSADSFDFACPLFIYG